MSSVPAKAAVRDRLIALLSEIANIDAARVTDDARIDNELQMQSVAFVELQVAIEDEYGIETDALRIVELNRFSAILDYLYDRISKAAA